MGIGYPLRRTTPQPWKETDVGADGTAAKHQLPVDKGVLNALPDTAQFAYVLLGYGAFLDGQIDDLRDGEESHGHRYEGDSIPQEEPTAFPEDRLEGKAWHALYGVKSDHGEDEAQGPRGETLEDVTAAKGSDKGDPHNGKHEEFSSADREDEWLDKGYR